MYATTVTADINHIVATNRGSKLGRSIETRQVSCPFRNARDFMQLDYQEKAKCVQPSASARNNDAQWP